MAGLGLGRAANGVDAELLSELAPELNVVHPGNVAAMRVAVAFDHRGVKLRERVLRELADLGHDVVDLGVSDDSVRIDYPDKAREIGEAIRSGEAERGVLICGSGVGAVVLPPASCRGSARRSATTCTPPTRASSTTT